MLIGRLLGWFQRRHTLHVFLLEILAVFVGITASLIVDDWQQQREDRQRLHNVLEEIHFGAVLDRANNRGERFRNRIALASTLALAYDNPDELSDDDLLRHFTLAVPTSARFAMPPGYSRLVTTTFSLPFDRTLAGLDGSFREIERGIDALNDSRDQIRDLVAELQGIALRPLDINRTGLDGLSQSTADQVSDLFGMLSGNSGYLADVDDTTGLREALRKPELRRVLIDLINRRADLGLRLILNEGRLNGVIETIREYSPDVALPVEAIGIDGDATGRGWSDLDGPSSTNNTVPMKRSSADPNLWTTTIDLVDGELKFRADNSWVIDWGVPRTMQNLTGSGAQFVFGGNPDDYFPSGTAEIRGINIPVRAGRYRVSFNSQTFDYRFERLE